jgi:uncharacterized protein
MYLLDTNIWLELLLQQDRAGEVEDFFQSVDASSLAMTDFTLYSIGIILTRLKKYDAFEDFVADVLEENPIRRIYLDSAGIKRIASVQKEFSLDFDDAYQYVAATENALILVSFDGDFEKTPLGRKTPAEVM